MSTHQLAAEALALPISDRISLAQSLWQSIGFSAAKDGQDLVEVLRRDDELSSGVVSGRTHEEVIQTARRAIGCT